MGKVLVILTDKYPFGSGETFVESERKYWSFFQTVYICPVLVRSNDTLRKGFVCERNERLVATTEQKIDLLSFIKSVYGSISCIELFNEFVITRNFANKKTALVLMLLTNLRFKRIFYELKKALYDIKESPILFYSYWMYEPALVAAGLKKHFINARFITRAHGYDLYEERQSYGYIPYRKKVLEGADAIYPISENGYTYLLEKYQKKYQNKMSVERLGTEKLFTSEHGKSIDNIRLVSCSNMIPLKRIDRIIETIKTFKCPLEWHHFGDGELMDSLLHMSKQLPPNITARFMGRVANTEVQLFYSSHHIDAFINVSETEGIPVSVMEALSYGIPVIATNVGGTSELIQTGKNGVLLEKNFSNIDLYEAINTVLAKQTAFRKLAFQTWEKMCNADTIYSQFFRREYELI